MTNKTAEIGIELLLPKVTTWPGGRTTVLETPTTKPERL